MSAKPYKPRLLKFAPYADPVLRKKTQPVTFPLSEEDKKIIEDMKYSIQRKQLIKAGAPWEDPVGMAANQWGIDKAIFLYCPTGDTTDLYVCINPSYEPIATLALIGPSEEKDWEACFSVPLSTGLVTRSNKIKIKYQNELGETLEQELSGWPARVWQHETDHLNGYLYDDPRHGKCCEKRVFKSREEVDDFYDDIREARRKK